MCRMIAALSKAPIHPSKVLIDGDNAFAYQSLEHPDGWGLVTYLDDGPQVTKSVVPAIIDSEFKEVCFKLKTTLLIGHIRRATTGAVNPNNNHPFVYKEWTFAHNGQISNFEEFRERLVAEVLPSFGENIVGTTDSEIYFYLFLSRYRELIGKNSHQEAWIKSIRFVVLFIRNLCDRQSDEYPSRLSCLISDGDSICGVSVGKELSVYSEPKEGNHLSCIASEMVSFSSNDKKYSGAWKPLKDGEGVLIGSEENLFDFKLT